MFHYALPSRYVNSLDSTTRSLTISVKLCHLIETVSSDIIFYFSHRPRFFFCVVESCSIEISFMVLSLTS